MTVVFQEALKHIASGNSIALVGGMHASMPKITHDINTNMPLMTFYFLPSDSIQSIEYLFPYARFVPATEMIINCFPRRQIIRHHPPSNSTFHYIEFRIDNTFLVCVIGRRLSPLGSKADLIRSYCFSLRALG